MMFQLVSPSKFFNHYPKQVQLVDLHSFQNSREEWEVHCSSKEICSTRLQWWRRRYRWNINKITQQIFMGEGNVSFFSYTVNPGQQRQHSLFLDRRTVTQQQPTFPRCFRLLWPVATGDVYSPAMADEMPLNYNRKYVITEEFVNFHMLCVGEISTCLSSFGRSSAVLWARLSLRVWKFSPTGIFNDPEYEFGSKDSVVGNQKQTTAVNIYVMTWNASDAAKLCD